MENGEIRRRVGVLVAAGLSELSPGLRAWAEGHLIVPRLIHLLESLEFSETSAYWLVTDHAGTDDSSYRVVYDERRDAFGFEVTLDDGRELFLGRVGSFAEAVGEL